MRKPALLAMVLVFATGSTAKAETIGSPTTWDYTFSTDFATCTATDLSCIATSGSVVFKLAQVTLDGTEQNSPCVKGGWEEVVGMTGTINGAPIFFTPQDVANCGADQLFLPSAQQGFMRPAISSVIGFSAGGETWDIFGPDIRPYGSSVLINNSEGQVAVINWNLVEEDPVATTEPSTAQLGLLSLAALIAAAVKTKSSKIRA